MQELLSRAGASPARKPRRARPDIVLREALFIRFLGASGSVSLAARLAGLPVSTAYRKRRDLAGFARCWRRAKARARNRTPLIKETSR